MAVIRNLVVKIAADISSLSKGLQTAQKQIQKVSATFTRAGTKLTASITAPLMALGTASVNVSQQFEQSMANAASVAGATGDDFARMTALAREMGSKTVFSASQAADALYYMASAGYKVDQMADSIQATLNLASATQSDLAFTTDTVISTLNQFQLEANQAERVTNVFAAAIGNSMANMEKLSNSMSYVGPVANSLGYSIEETTGALSVLYNAGYDGSTAGTSLRQSLVALMNPTAAALDVFKELGLIYEEVNPATNDLATIIDTVKAIKQFWEKNGKKIWNTVKTIFTNIWMCVKNAFSIIKDSLNKFFSYVKPIWEKLKTLFASLWDTLVQLYETLKPVFELIGGLVMTLWGVVSSVLGAIIDALGPFIEAVIDVANAILDIIKIICAVLRGDWSSAWQYMQDFAGNIWSAIKNIFLGIWEFIKGFGENICSFFGNCGETIGNIFKSVWEGVSGFFSNIWEGIKSMCGWIWDTITGLFNKIGDFFKNLISDAFNWGKNLISNIGDGIKKGWDWVVDGVKGVGQSIADFLGFGSPTKKGPGHTADEWIPNLMDMMAEGMYANIPMI